MRIRLAACAAVLATTGLAAAPTAVAEPIDVPGAAMLDGWLGNCLALVPGHLSLTNTPVDLDVRILLDGATPETAASAVASMRKAYEPIGITVRESYETVSFSGAVAESLIEQAKAHYGGERPDGIDIVYVLSDKDVTGGAYGSALAGLADCLGGVRFDDRAFAVGQVNDDGDLSEATGKTMAHEIGHLLGAHHHYSSPEGLLAPSPNVLSLMSPDTTLASLRFSTLEAAVVGGYAARYAR
ncbi:zinc-dependent metalloprotease family protein [uncultured Nocardioides sp.]|jgi:hypothetical protein|uniref:zinc-dependent metalloprotease family protein n=1 Tax=uncultured Nocardioides sp. TaxID=198441 RepID=UPI000C36C67A|nr:zinc-dependent metalloprotease family protein [uncultured Nocardioides sp.]MAO80401.1 hypothetical protein [Nocardioides sp.]MBU2074613.1 hypothetical protein [Actinomycetota bacterium]